MKRIYYLLLSKDSYRPFGRELRRSIAFYHNRDVLEPVCNRITGLVKTFDTKLHRRLMVKCEL